MKNIIVSVVMGSDSDLPVMEGAVRILEEFGVGFEVLIASAHRSPEATVKFAKGAEKRGIKVIVAGAGGAAHLPGVIAAMTSLPVIGIPIKSQALSGIDSLYSIVQMPSGVPVATVGINGAKNAAILAVEMLGISDIKLRKAVKVYKKKLRAGVAEKQKRLDRLGVEKYLKFLEENKK